LLGALMAWRLKDGAVVARAAERVPPLLVLKTVARRPTVLLLATAFAGMVFVNVGFLTWMPTYLHERFGLSLAEAGFSSMFYHHLGAFIGVAIGGRLSDRLAIRRPAVRPAMQAAALCLGAPFIYLLGTGGSMTAVAVSLALFGVFRGVYDANIYAALYEVIEPRFHASAASVIIAFAFTAGAFAPFALGAAKGAIGLSGGLSSLSAVYLFASAVALIATCFFFSRDRARVNASAEYNLVH
jgi:nitrate/nitrite transporter NarK